MSSRVLSFPAGNETGACLLQCTCLLLLTVVGTVFLAGCGYQQSRTAEVSGIAGLAGSVFSGQQPIAGATIQLYAAGGGGDDSASTPLLTTEVQTNSDGEFKLGPYICPSASTNIYVTATGGSPGLPVGQTNSKISLMVALGPCENLALSTVIKVNELSTVAATYALSPFMKSYTLLGSGPSDTQLMADAFTLASEMVNSANGTAPGVGVPTGQTVPVQKINTLANIVSTCVNSDGNITGDDSPCGSLFSLVTPPDRAAPQDTISALLDIANNPTAEVHPLYLLKPFVAPYVPFLSNSPPDWTMRLSALIAPPLFSPAPGSYAVPPAVTLSDVSSGALIFYTTDGSVPTSSAHVYSEAISLPASTTIKAIAISGTVSSIGVSATYTVQAPALVVKPTAVPLTASQSQSFAATVSGVSNTAVTWSLNPSIGSISASGVYYAPMSIESPKTLEVTATSAADASISASATVSLVPSRPTTLVFLSSPSSTTAASPLTPAVSVAIEDGKGNILTNATNTISISLGSKSPGGVLGGVKTEAAMRGVSTFSGLTITTVGTGYTLLATSAGLSSATSVPFTVAAPLPFVTSRMADDLVNSVGLNVHFSYYGSIYTSQASQLIRDIGQLGVRHVRDQMEWEGSVVGASPFYTIHNQLASNGVKTDYILTSINYPMSQVAAYPKLVNDMEAVEPTNEYDASGDPQWVERITAQESNLFQQVNSSPVASGTTVLSPSLAQPANASLLGGMSSISEVGNSHAYFGGWNPGNTGTGGANDPNYFIKLAGISNPGQPTWISETGFYTVPGYFYAGYGISEAAQAIYTPRVLLEFWKAGAARTYLYELADYSKSDFWGLIRSDGTAKPAFSTLANFISLLDDPGPSFAPETLACKISGANSQVQQVLVQKRDGSFYLIIWAEAQSYNFLTQDQISVPAQLVTLQVGRTVLSATTYQLLSDGTMTASTLPPGQILNLHVTDSVQIVKLVLK